MQRKKPDVDIISDVLKASREAYPNSAFIQSLSLQYQERGGLSKKQLEGLYKKAEKIETIPVNWLATLEAEILKRPTRYKSTLPPPKPLYEKDEKTGSIIEAILKNIRSTNEYYSFNPSTRIINPFLLRKLQS